MTGLHPEQFRRLVIRPTLQGLGLWSPAAERLLLGTAVVESGLKFLTQHGDGPARGVYQIEPATADDLAKNWLTFRPRWAHKLAAFASEQPSNGQLVSNLAYATAVARLIYYRRPEALPDPENLRGLADYWKAHFNTTAGKGDPAKFVSMMRPLWFGAAIRDDALPSMTPALRPATSMPVGFAMPDHPPYSDFLERYPDQASPRAARVRFTRPRQRELITVKRQVDDNCPYLPDKPGRDIGTILQDGQGGDCEDFVYTLIARLKALGWPIGALRPAICRTRAGVGHMVLCIVTEGAGVYVADNLLNHIAPWAGLSHQWICRLDGPRWRMILRKP